MSYKDKRREHQDLEMEFDYELINDTYTKWNSEEEGDQSGRRISVVDFQNIFLRGQKKELITKTEQMLRKKKNHPLSIMVKKVFSSLK